MPCLQFVEVEVADVFRGGRFFFSKLDTGSVVLPSWRKRQKDVLSFRVCAIGSHTMDGYGPEEGHQCVFSLFAS